MTKDAKLLLKSSFKISLDEAAYLILSFLREPKLNNLAVNEAIGGTVSKGAIKNEAGFLYLGTMGWFCRKDSNAGEFPKLFMAFEDGSYEIAKVPEEPVSATLKCPASTFTYKKGVNEEDVLWMLRNDSYPLEPDLDIPKSVMMNLTGKLPKDDHGVPYNKFACSFFENRGELNKDMQEFLDTPNLEGVRYYFGYDTSYSHARSNRIRVIFVGVDASGKNIIPGGDITAVSAQIVQNSWPPPPPPNSIAKDK